VILNQMYIVPQQLLAFGAELLWLMLSGLVLCAVANTTAYTHAAPTLVIYQASALSAMYLLVFYLMDLYQESSLEPGYTLCLHLVPAVCIGFVVTSGFERETTLLPFRPLLAAVHLLLTAAFMLIARAGIHQFGVGWLPKMCVGIVTKEALEDETARGLERYASHGPALAWLGKSLWDAQLALENRPSSKDQINCLAIDLALLEDVRAIEFLKYWRLRGVYVESLDAFVERTSGKTRLNEQIASAITVSQKLSPSPLNIVVRRSRDITLACIGLVVTLPLSLVIAVALRVESSGPILFKQSRVGEHGKLFVMLKFRSMYQNVALGSEREWITQANDPRVTRVGKVLRLLHLDEIPQLINVIRGEMSLVGPRPFHPCQVSELESVLPSFGLRHLVRPGITGWAQISCNYEASMSQSEEVLARDLYYIKHAGLLFDLLIMLATLRVCLWRRGAR
jgi:lipopolysaccharide/colanic/teichoic acid biosynthesis glycosyltransferase